MDLTITEEERREIRMALNERADELEKLSKKNSEKGLFNGVADANYHLCLIRGGPADEVGLLDKLQNPEVEGRQRGLFDRDDNPPVEDSLKGIEEEAAARILARQRAALKAALPPLPETDGDYAPSDEELTELIGDAWDDVIHTFEGKDYASLFRFEAELPLPVVSSVVGTVGLWCMLRGSPAPAFYYDIASPEDFNMVDAIPTFEGEQLLREVRRAYFDSDEDEAPIEDLLDKDVSEVTPEQYEQATRPTPESTSDVTGILLMGLHHVLFMPAGAREAWYSRAAEPMDDADLEGAIIAAVQMAADDVVNETNHKSFTLSLPIVDRESGNTEDHVEYAITVDPPCVALNARKKADRHAIAGDRLLQSVRVMLGIPGEEPQFVGESAVNAIDDEEDSQAPFAAEVADAFAESGILAGSSSGLFGDDDE